MPYVQVGTEGESPVELYYEDHGSGRPVVLIHGWPLSGRSWELQVPALIEAGYRVITYDRRGFGKSSQPWSGYDYDTLTSDLSVLLDHLDVTDAVLVGFSMGGGEVVRYLSHSDAVGQDRVGAAVLAGAVTPYLLKTDDNPDGGVDDAWVTDFIATIAEDRPAFLADFLVAFFAAGDDQDLISDPSLEYYRQIAAFASPQGTLDCVDSWARTDFRADLERITVPTLVIHGDSDGTVPIEVSGRRSHAAIEGSELVVVPGAPHGFPVTHAEEFNRALLAFLSGTA